MPKHIEGPQGHPGGPNGPAAVLQDTPRGGATWKYAVSQNPAALDQISCRTPYLWGEQAPQPNPPSREGTTPLTLTPDITPKGSTTYNMASKTTKTNKTTTAPTPLGMWLKPAEAREREMLC